MSKKSSGSSYSAPPAAPAFQPSTTMYGDQVVGKTYKDASGNIVDQYLPSAAEQQNKKYAQDAINQILPTLGGPDSQVAQAYKDQANAWADQQTAAFNRQFEPAQRANREDYASRFGGLANTPYVDSVNNMEQNIRTPALLDISRTATQMGSDLYNQDQQRKMNQLQALGYSLNGNQQNFLSGLNAPLNTSQIGNNFNLSNYTNQLQAYNSQQNRNAQSFNSGVGLLRGIF